MRKIKMFCDPMVAAMAVAWFGFAMPLPTIVLLPACYIQLKQYGIDAAFICNFVLIVVCLIGGWIIPIFYVPMYFSYILIDSNGIKYVEPLKKSVYFEYTDFKVVKLAYYEHIYTKRIFLVLSRHVVSSSDLTHINTVRSDENLIKIKMSRKRFNTLINIAPEHIKSQLTEAMNGNLSKVAIDIDAEKRKLFKQQHKRKRKKNTKNKRNVNRYNKRIRKRKTK